jgi:hypothetical protein
MKENLSIHHRTACAVSLKAGGIGLTPVAQDNALLNK